MDPAIASRRRILKKFLAWAFWAGNLLTIVLFWWFGSGQALLSGSLGATIAAFGLLAGLIATFCALTQFVLMSRAGWLESIFGLDRLAQFHRLNGYATILLILAHPPLVALGHAMLRGVDFVAQYFALLASPFVPLAVIAELLFLAVVGASIYIVRKHLKFETWYAVHLMVYLAIVLMFWHQFANGQDLLTNPNLVYYWIALYLFAALNVVIWRWSLPITRFFYFGFTVEKVVPETSTAASVYITGRNLEKFRARGGQFVMVRFLTKDLWFQEHPFSLSQLPNSQHIRLTIRNSGDFTSQVPMFRPGTKVMVSGPYGAFTHQQQRTRKVLYVAGGVGITPIRSMIQERTEPASAVLLYGNRTRADTIFLNELRELTAKRQIPLHNILSDQKDYTGETGYIDTEKVLRLVPDAAERDIFICGPPVMITALVNGLKAAGVPEAHIHYERFALHKK